ncbi:uncharacterized protein [Hemitrygon akajei]|uniref:uncharacterized protein n=1 Tax=Hemitrygon akajei TaxID=2704970 RepID=UPI003BFA1C9F
MVTPEEGQAFSLGRALDCLDPRMAILARSRNKPTRYDLADGQVFPEVPLMIKPIFDEPKMGSNMDSSCVVTRAMAKKMDEEDGSTQDGSGGWKIPETEIPRYHCSGWNPGWLDGSHPNVGQGEVTRTVYFTEGEGSYYFEEVKVKNCSDYFVYWLKPTSSNAVYCTGSSTGKQTDGSVSGEHTQKSSSVPAGDTSPGPGTSTGKQSERSSTGDFSQETSSDPARDTASDQETSTGEQPKGSTTGGCIQKPSSAPMDTSGEEDGWIDVQVTASGDMSEEEVREAIRNKLREMFDDPDPQIELVQCTSEPPEE